LKKLVSLILLVILMLSCVGIIACGESTPTSTQTPIPTQTPTPTPTPAPTSPPADGFTWDDMPIYAGGNQVQKGSWSIPPAEEEWAKVEWRYYELDGANDVDMVARFYCPRTAGKKPCGWKYRR